MVGRSDSRKKAQTRAETGADLDTEILAHRQDLLRGRRPGAAPAAIRALLLEIVGEAWNERSQGCRPISFFTYWTTHLPIKILAKPGFDGENTALFASASAIRLTKQVNLT